MERKLGMCHVDVQLRAKKQKSVTTEKHQKKWYTLELEGAKQPIVLAERFGDMRVNKVDAEDKLQPLELMDLGCHRHAGKIERARSIKRLAKIKEEQGCNN
nr:hypothetical protein [Tanacetum cinerariifolium]